MTTGARLELPDTPSRSPFAGLDVCETVSLPLPNGVAGPRFEYDVWDFADVIGMAAYLRPVACRVDFTTIKNPSWRIVAKEYALALMAPNHPAVSGSTQRLPETARRAHLRRAARRAGAVAQLAHRPRSDQPGAGHLR